MVGKENDVEGGRKKNECEGGNRRNESLLERKRIYRFKRIRNSEKGGRRR